MCEFCMQNPLKTRRGTRSVGEEGRKRVREETRNNQRCLREGGLPASDLLGERLGVRGGHVTQQLEPRQGGEAAHGHVVLDVEPAQGGVRRGTQPGDGRRALVRDALACGRCVSVD